MNLKAAACAAALLCGCAEQTQTAAPADSTPPPPAWTSQVETAFRLQSQRDRNLPEVTRLAVRGDTTLFSLHPRERLVRVFNTDGTVLHTIRAPRAGASFRSLTDMGLIGESLWVYDSVANRVYTFDRDFKLLAGRTPPLERAGAGATFESPLPGDNYLARVPLSTDGSSGVTPRFALVRLGPATPDTLVTVKEADHRLALQGSAPLPNPFAQRAFVAVSPADHSIVIAEPPANDDDKTWGLSRITSNGDTVFSKRIPYSPIEITPGLRELAATRLQAQAAGSSVSAAALQQALAQPRLLPPVTGLVVAIDGTILVRAEDTGTDEMLWYIFSPMGEARATQTTPSTTRFMAAGGPFFFGADRDADSVIVLSRYRVVPK